MELGIGAGWNEEECDAFGIELGTLRERFDRFEEGLAVIDSLLTNDRTTFDGSYYRLAEAMNNPKPVQAKIPMCIGGVGRRRTIPLVARHADHWNYGGSDPGEFAELRGLLHEACHSIGREPDEITCSCLIRYESDDALLGARVAEMEAAGADLVDRLAPEVGAAVGRRARRGGDRMTELLARDGRTVGCFCIHSIVSLRQLAPRILGNSGCAEQSDEGGSAWEICRVASPSSPVAHAASAAPSPRRSSREGAQVVITGRSSDEGRAGRRGDRSTRRHAVRPGRRQAASRLRTGHRRSRSHAFGKIDILVNNAGGASNHAPVADLTDEAFEDALLWNVWSTFWCIPTCGAAA